MQASRRIVKLTNKETRVMRMMLAGYVLEEVRYSRNYGLFVAGVYGKPEVETVQRRVVESLKAKGVIKVAPVNGRNRFVAIAKPEATGPAAG